MASQARAGRGGTGAFGVSLACLPENGLAGVWAASLSQGLSATEGLGLLGKEGLEDYKFILQTICSGEFVFTLLKLKQISIFFSNKSKFEAAFELVIFV